MFNNIKKSIKTNFFVIFITIFFYLLFELFLLSYEKYQINPDILSYISISQSFSKLNFHDAVNSYWGPMTSWLLIPFISASIDPLLSVKIINCLCSIAILIVLYKTSIHLNIKYYLNFIMLIGISFYLLSFATYDTPDLLFAFFVLATWYTTIKLYSNPGYKNATIVGLLGSCCYFTKSYGLPLIIVFLIINCLYTIVRRNFSLLSQLLISVFVFTLISVSWILCLSEKYNTFTYGTSGSYNYSLVGPNTTGHTMFTTALMPPPTEQAKSSWEDPSLFQYKSWSPLKSKYDMLHQLSIIKINVITIFKYHLPVVLTLSFVLSLIVLRKECVSPVILMSIILVSTYLGGYSLIFSLPRYLIPVPPILMFIVVYLLNKLSEIGTKFWKLSCLLLTLVVSSLSFVPSSLDYLRVQTEHQEGIEYYQLANRISQTRINGNIASNKNWESPHLNWVNTLFIAYYLPIKYFGYDSVIKDESSEAIYKHLKEKNINYYFLWGENSHQLLNNKYKLIGRFEDPYNRLPLLSIYKIQ